MSTNITERELRAWELNMERLQAGAFGSPEDSKTLLHYWEAQEAADYPGAGENVKYFTDIVEKESPKRGLDLPTTKAYIVQEMQDRLKEKINNLEYQAKTPRASIRVEILNEQVNWVLKEVVPACIDEVAALMLKEDDVQVRWSRPGPCPLEITPEQFDAIYNDDEEDTEEEAKPWPKENPNIRHEEGEE